MKYIEKPSGCFIDRRIKEPTLDPVDVVTLTLDAENFLERCLYTVYREIPVRKLFVCDGGSKDATLKILKNFPRIEVHEKPDIKTTGKGLEFLFSLIETNWFVILDADLELFSGWYDEMCKHQDYDALENGRRIRAYHIYRDDPIKLENNIRSYSFCHLVKRVAVQNYHCDDDYMWRSTDILFRQSIEKSGYKYVKINTTTHIHNETEGERYTSDDDKNFRKYVWEIPKAVIIDEKKRDLWNIKNAKAIVKYLDPDHQIMKDNKSVDRLIIILDRKWVQDNGNVWLKRYDDAKALYVKNERKNEI